MGVRGTSRASYRKMKTKMGDKQRELYSALKEIEPASDRDLALKLDWSISHITPRRGELVKYGYIIEAGRKFDVETGRRVMAWVTADPMTQRVIERAAGKERHPVTIEESEQPEPAAPEPKPEEPTREVLLVQEAGEWVESNQIPATLRRRQQQYRTQRIGIESGTVHYDMLTYWEDGYEEHKQVV